MKLAAIQNLRGEPDRDASLARYRSLSSRYDSTCVGIIGIRRAAIDALAVRGGETVFDVVCGTGATLVELAEHVGPSGTVIGVEQCPEMAAVARMRVANAASRVCCCTWSRSKRRRWRRAPTRCCSATRTTCCRTRALWLI